MNVTKDGKIVFYNTREDCVRHFLHDYPNFFDNIIPNEKDIFRMIATKLVEAMDSNVSGWEYEIDYDGFVWDFYEDVWKEIIKPIITNNKNLMQMISDIKVKEVVPTIIQIPSKEIDEEELDKIYKNYSAFYNECDSKICEASEMIIEEKAFKAGYRKARE